MQGSRACWTDERLDGFASLVDRRLDRIDKQGRREHEERDRRQWDDSRRRFESRMQLIYWMFGVGVGMALATIVFLIATAS